jgi:iron(III) transport system permease protein
LAAGAFIGLIDIAKELPASLLLRPFYFETLATQIYRLASAESVADAAPAAIILVGASLIPVLWLEALSRRREAKSG